MASITRCGDCKPVVNDNVTVNDSISCVPMLNDRGPEKKFCTKIQQQRCAPDGDPVQIMITLVRLALRHW